MCRYFNVPGALLLPALAVYDTMQAMSNEIETLNLGLTTGRPLASRTQAAA